MHVAFHILFMKIFRTASPTVVIECQHNFCFLPVALQIQIRTTRFLQVFTATANSLCLLFHDNAGFTVSRSFCSQVTWFASSKWLHSSTAEISTVQCCHI